MEKSHEGIAETFESLGLHPWLGETCKALGINSPTPIQTQCIPPILQGRDVIASAPTGSGKTAAFALPILQILSKDPYGIFAVILSPTRELAFQIGEQFEALGKGINLKKLVIVGGLDMMGQSLAISKKPHILISTPGRLADHILSSGSVDLKRVKFLVFDEADKVLDESFSKDMEVILSQIPAKRQTLLFSATITRTIEKLESYSLKEPFICHVANKFDTVAKLKQQYLFVPFQVKDNYLVYLLRNQLQNKSVIIFSSKFKCCEKIKIMLRELGIKSTGLHSYMSQSDRLSSLAKFKSQIVNILIATDVASRGLDIPLVECVLNYDIPSSPKDYIHRVGRTARAGRGGVAITIMSQQDIEIIQNLEKKIQKTLEELELPEEEVLKNLNEVSTAKHVASMEILESEYGKKKQINEQKRRIAELREQEENEDHEDDGDDGDEDIKEEINNNIKVNSNISVQSNNNSNKNNNKNHSSKTKLNRKSQDGFEKKGKGIEKGKNKNKKK